MSFINYSKIDEPPSGFILQKDVYTTNLLYAYDLFPLKYLNNLPFRIQKKENNNPNYSFQILPFTGNKSFIVKKQKLFNFINKPKKVNNICKQKLKFPIPKRKIISLKHLNLYEGITKKNIKIKNMDDDLNISSNHGKKFIYKYKENKSFKAFPPISLKKGKNIKLKNENSLSKISMKKVVKRLNNDLRNIKLIESNRKKSFVKDRFFSTQINIENG